MQVQVKDLLDERLVLLQFRNKESVENQQRIQKLETRIVASERTYKEMSGVCLMPLNIVLGEVLLSKNTDQINTQFTEFNIKLSIPEYFQRSLALACEEIDRKAAQRSDEIIQLSEKVQLNQNQRNSDFFYYVAY